MKEAQSQRYEGLYIRVVYRAEGTVSAIRETLDRAPRVIQAFLRFNCDTLFEYSKIVCRAALKYQSSHPFVFASFQVSSGYLIFFNLSKHMEL